MNSNVSAMQAVLAKIEEYDKIVIFRHRLPDGDAIGSTKGLREILRLSYPEKEVYLNNCDSSDYLEFLGDEDEPVEMLFCFVLNDVFGEYEMTDVIDFEV